MWVALYYIFLPKMLVHVPTVDGRVDFADIDDKTPVVVGQDAIPLQQLVFMVLVTRDWDKHVSAVQ